jgi:hypothetical protein
MELTLSCPRCKATVRVAAVETETETECRQCGAILPLHPEATGTAGLVACPACMTADLYVQKDFPQGLGLFIIFVGFAISTVFWYYEMPIPAYLVLVVSILLDYVMYHAVPDVTICYRCLSQLRGPGSNADDRFKPFDLAIGERYRQERLRVQQLRTQGASPDRSAVAPGRTDGNASDAPRGERS